MKLMILDSIFMKVPYKGKMFYMVSVEYTKEVLGRFQADKSEWMTVYRLEKGSREFFHDKEQLYQVIMEFSSRILSSSSIESLHKNDKMEIGCIGLSPAKFRDPFELAAFILGGYQDAQDYIHWQLKDVFINLICFDGEKEVEIRIDKGENPINVIEKLPDNLIVTDIILNGIRKRKFDNYERESSSKGYKEGRFDLSTEKHFVIQVGEKFYVDGYRDEEVVLCMFKDNATKFVSEDEALDYALSIFTKTGFTVVEVSGQEYLDRKLKRDSEGKNYHKESYPFILKELK